MRWRSDGEMVRYFVYILSNQSITLYVGVTGDLSRRIAQHANRSVRGFTSRYRFDRLVYFEECGDAASAIQREKTIKGWTRGKKIALVKSKNPKWEDLSGGLFHRRRPPARSSSSEG